MNAPVLLAQLSGSTQAPPPKTLKIAKPGNAQALSFHLDGNTRLDFSDISSEKLTFVKIGEKLIVLFDNQSTVTIDPVFDSATGNPLADIGFQVGDRTLDGAEFAALFPIGTDQSVLPAAGGNASGPTGGANFADAQVNGLGPGGNPLALLGDEQFGGPEFGANEPGLAQIGVGTAVVGAIDDEGLADGIVGGPGDAPGNATSVINASLNLNFGTLGASSATLAFLTTQPELSGLTSGGHPINLLISNTPGGTPTIIGFIGNDPDAPGSHVFEITLGLTTNTGEYSFTLLRPLDHPVHGTEDTIPLVIHYSATNAAGTVFPDFTVNVNDDSPDLNPEGFDLPITQGESPVAHADLKDPASGTSVRGGTLGILWGADNFNDNVDGGVSQTTGQNGDRSLVFANATVNLSSGETPLTSNLYSHGEQVHFVLQENGTLLVAFTGESPSETNTVFTVKLHDTNSGSYVFTQYQELDHVGSSGEEGQPVNLDSLNLSFHYAATDSDGDSINESFSVTVGDDVPTISIEGIQDGKVDEDYLANGNDGDTYAQPPAPGTGDFKFTGNLGVSWGADNNNTGSIANRSLAFNGITEGAAATDHSGNAILSHDQAVQLHLTTIGGQPALVGYTGADADNQSNWVFTVTLDDSTNTGSYTFTLLKPIDHPTSNAEDNIQIDFGFTATDADGDPASSTFHVTVNDDAPIQTGATITGTAAEDDLADFNPLYPLVFDFWQGSLGTSPYDGSSGDNSHTGLLGTVPVWGNLSSLVKPGADGPGEFHLVTESQAESVLAHLGPNSGTLSSHGDVINDVRMVDIPNIGEAMGFFASDGRLVFGLFVDAGGNYNFRLFDQLDHPIGDNPNTAALESVKDTLNIDLSQFVTYTDFDKDTITLSAGTFSVNVVDDTPVVVGHEAVNVNENDLANFNPLYPLVFDFWQGSLGSSPYDGATDDSSYSGLLGTVTAWGTLADNVRGGADEFGKFELVSENRANDILATLGADGGPLKSHGDVINDARMVDIPGLGEVMGFFASDGRLVFGLFVSENGVYNFRLFDQLDHAAPTQNPNGDQVADENSLNIDLSKFVTYTDYDHDTVDLGTNTFVVTVVDDIPHVIGSLTVTLDESHLNNFLMGWDLIPGAIKDLYPVEGSSGTNPNADTDLLLNTTSQQGFLDEIIGNNVVNGGADEFGKFGLVSEQRAHDLLATMGIDSKGEHIDHVKLVDIAGLGTVMGFFAGDRVVFTLTVTDAGFYDLRLFDQVDHTGANGTSLNIDLSKFVTYTDFDGDMINLGTSNLVLTVLDDAPVPVSGAQVFGTVEEEQIDLINSLLGADMGHGNEDTGSVGGDDLDTDSNPLSLGSLATSNVTIGSLASLVKVGADENGTFSFDTTVAGTQVKDSTGSAVTSHGEAIIFGFKGGQLVGYVDSDHDNQVDNGERVIFTVSLNDINPLDNVNNDLFTFTLLDAIDHNNPNGLSTEDLKNLDLSKTIRFTDFDGDSTGFGTNSFQIKVIDDTPRQTGSTLKGTVEEEENVGAGTPEMNHGNEDTANEPLFLGIFDQTTNKATGNLGSLVSVGGDEVSKGSILGIPVYYGTFSFGATTSLPTVMSKGEQVLYALSDTNGDGLNDTLVGSTASGRPVFTLTIVNNTGGGKTAGDYVFTLLDQIDHPAGGGENIANIDFSSVIRFSDCDGDTITLTNGSFSIDVIDDQPVSKGDVTASDVLDDEGQTIFVPANTGGTGDASGQKTVAQGGAKSLFSIGADDLGSITITDKPSFSVLFANGNGFAQAESVQWHDPVTAADGTVTLTGYSDHYATVATLVIKIDGSYTFTLNAPVVHPTNQASEEEVPLKFKYTVTDFDQDSVTGSLTINVDDDTPKITTPAVTAQLDDEAQSLFPGNGGGTNDVADVKQAIGNAGALFTAGSDGVQKVTATPGTFSVIFKDTNGLAGSEAITWSATGVQGANGETKWIATSAHYDADHPAATLIIRVDGSYTFTLNAPVKNDTSSATNEDNLTISIPFTVTDGDGDVSTQGTLTVKVNDDTPTVGTQTALTVDEEGLGGNPGDTYAATNPHDAGTSLASANGTLNYSFGSDGASATTNVTFLTSNLAALNLTSGGQGLTYGWDQASHTLTAKTTGGDTVFTLQVTNVLTGAYTFSMSKPLDHLGANSANSEDDITIPFQFTITDGDGDTTAPATVNITINDDAPTFTAGLVENTTVDEEGINGNPGAPAPYAGSDYAGEATTASGGLGISWGADNGNSGTANRSLAFNGITEGAAVLNDANVAITSHGAAVKYHLVTSGDTQTLIGYTGNDANNTANYVFTVRLDDTTTTGTYNFTLLKNLDHPTPNTEDDISIKFNFTAKDADKDTVTGSFKVTIDDDSPIITAAQNGGVDEDNLVPNGNHDSAPGDLADDGTLVAHGSLGISYGADGPGVGAAANPGVSQTFDFTNHSTNIDPYLTVNAHFGVVGNAPVGALGGGQNAPVVITATNGHPFELDSVKLSFAGGPSLTSKITVIAKDVGGQTYTFDVSVQNVFNLDGSTPTTFNTTGSPIDGKQLVSVSFGVYGNQAAYVQVDDVTITRGAAPEVPGPVYFSDLGNAAANVTVTDSDGHNVTLNSLTSNGQPVLFKLIDSVTLVAYTGSEPSSIGASNVVFSVVLSGTGSGSYDFTLKGTLDHPLHSTEDDLVFSFNYTAKDFDGDTTSGAFKVTVDDDMPVIVSPATGENLIVNGQFTDNVGFSPLSWGGQAAPANSDIKGWHIAGNNLERNPANWYVPDPADGGRVVDLDATPGNVSLSQTFNNLQNGQSYTLSFDAAKPAGFDAKTEVYWNGQLVGTVSPNADHFEQFSITVTAGSGANTLEFREIGAADNGGTFLANVAMHATNAIVNEDSLSGGNAGGLGDATGTTASATGSLGIKWGADAGDVADAGNVQDGTSANALSDNVAALTGRAVYFTDANSGVSGLQPSVTALVGASAITLLSAGQEVHYQILENGTKLVGYTGSFNVASQANWVFTVSLSDEGTGKYTFNLLKPLDHPMSGSEDDINLVLGFTARDADGDTANSTLTITVDDDTPVIAAPAIPTNLIIDGQLAGDANDFQTPGSWSTHAAIDTGGNLDNGAWTYAASNVGGSQVQVERVDSGYRGVTSSNGNPLIDLEASPGNIQLSQTVHGLTSGQAFQVSFEIGQAADGSGTAKLEVLWNGVPVDVFIPPVGGTQVYSVSVVALGGDNVLTFREIGQAGDNTGTYLTNVSMYATNAIVDEDALGGNPGGVGDVAGANASASGSLGILWGADSSDTIDSGNVQDGTTANALSDNVAALTGRAVYFTDANPGLSGLQPVVTAVAGANAITLHSAGQEVHYQILENGTKLVGYTGTFDVNSQANWVFTVSLSDEGTGKYTFNLLKTLDHPISGTEDDINITFGFTARDADGDTASSTLTITVDDDTPVLVGSADTITVDETNTPFAQSGFGSLHVSMGADKGGAVLNFATDNNGLPLHPAELTSDGTPLDYVLRTTQYGEKQLVAFKHGATADDPVFIVALSSPANPTYIFTLFQNLDHAEGSNTLDLNFTIRVTDGDGDFVDRTVDVTVKDSVPTIPATAEQVTGVQDDALNGGNPEPGDTKTASGTLSHNFGADENGHLSWLNPTLPATGGYSSAIDGNTLDVYQLQNAVNVKVFTVTLDPVTGDYTITQIAPIHHPSGNGETGESFDLNYRVTDGDTDYVDSHLKVIVGDDIPVIGGVSAPVNLLTNGDFTSGSFPHTESWGQWATDGTGWKISGTVPGQTGVQLELIQSGYLGVVTSNGHPMVDLAATPGDVAISQSLNGLTVGQHYTLNFEIGASDPSSAGLEVYWNGNLVGTYHPGQITAIATLDLTAISGANTITFKEIGSADNTGTYLANVSLVQASADSLPVFHANIGEDAPSIITFANGVDFNFGADGPGAVTFDTAHATITTPAGTTLGLPTMSYDPVTGKLTVDPGGNFDSLSEGEIATLTVPFTVTDADGDSKTGIYQFTITGSNDAPVISGTEIAARVFEAGGLNSVVTADVASDHRFEPIRNVDGAAAHAIDLTVNTEADMKTVVLNVQTALGNGATVADAIASVWDYLDDVRLSIPNVDQAYYAPLINKATVLLGLVYGDYLEHGGRPLLDVIVKYTPDGDSSGAPDRVQSLHDNLLGAVDTPSIDDKFSSDPTLLADLKAQIQAAGLTDRPIYSGNEYVQNNALGWDLDPVHGVLHASSGQLTATDAEGDALTWSITNGSSYGTMSIDQTGKWTYVLDNGLAATQALAEGETKVEAFTATVTDSHGATDTQVITITIVGTNDAPVLSVDSESINETSAVNAGTPIAFTGHSVLANDTDVDHGAALAVISIRAANPIGQGAQEAPIALVGGEAVAHGTYGNLTMHADGTYTYTPNAAFDAIPQGQTVTDVFKYGVTDDHGASAASFLTITITGANDGATITGTYTGDVTEDGAVQTASGTLTVNDVDTGDNHFQTPNPLFLLGTYGHFTFNASSGAWTYTLDNAATNVQALKATDTVYDTLTVMSNDGTASQTINITIHGTNDAPVIDSHSGVDLVSLSVAENTTAVTTVHATDIDSPTITYTIDGGADAALFTVNSSTGALSFINAPDFENPLDAGHDNHYNVTVKASDGTLFDTQAFDIAVTDVTETLPHTTIADTSPYYAFSNNAYAASVSQPATINFDADNIFGGGSDTFTFTFTQVYSNTGTNWLTVNAAQGTVTGDPTNLSALTVYRIDAVDTVTHEHTFTYVAFSALPDSNSQYVQITNNASYNDSWKSDVVQVAAGSSVPGSTMISGASASDVLIGNDNANTLNGDSGNDALYGGGGNDVIYGGGNTSFLSGGAGNDKLYSSQYGGGDPKFMLGGDGDDQLYGGHDDVLMGGAGNDIIVSGNGKNLIVGGEGNDTLTGGSNRDTYVFLEAGDSNVDRITNYDNSTGVQDQDVIDLSYLLDSISTDKASHVRFLYSDAGHSTHVLTDPSALPTADGDVTIQVNTTGTWQSVVTIADTGSNLTAGSNAIQMMLDHATVQQFHA